MTALKDGIYFRLPMDDYLALERLSKSGIKRLRISPADFWQDSYLNPHKEELTPEQERHRARDKMIGRAYHSARLEPELFSATYAREPGKEEAPEGTLFTATDMKPELKERDLKLSGSTEEQALRLAEDGFPREKLWHLVMADWEASLPEGAIRLSSTDYDKIAEDGRRLLSLPGVAELLTGGAAEVSVLYTCPDTGIPMKSRFDYLRTVGWTELKTFSNPHGKNLIQCINDAFRFNRYHIDAASYLQAIDTIHSGDLEIIGDATKDERALITALRDAGGRECRFVWQQTGGVPNILERKVRLFHADASDAAIAELERMGASEDHIERAKHFKDVAGDREPARTALHVKARMEIMRAKQDFLNYSEMYSPGEPWLPFNPSGETTDDDFHPSWLETV